MRAARLLRRAALGAELWEGASHRGLRTGAAARASEVRPGASTGTEPPEPGLAPPAPPHAGAPRSGGELAGAAAALAAGDPPPGSAAPREGPLPAYLAMRGRRLVRPDARQEALVLELQRVWDELAARYPEGEGGAGRRRRASGLVLVDAADTSGGGGGSGGWFAGFFGGGGGSPSSEAPAAPPPRGLYMHGGVGVGKTMLMDAFVASCPPRFRAERAHFHDFMLGVHAALRAAAGAPDPLARVAAGIAARARVLALDEFFVTDVADAAILSRLFAALWDAGVVLVATSNRAPEALYEGGLQRHLFLPFIARLQRECVAHDMASPVDYRRLAQHRGGLYLTGPGADAALEARFAELAAGRPEAPLEVDVAMGRRLTVRRAAGCAAYATFDELCAAALGAADYIALARARHTLLLAGVPRLGASNRSAAYRFVTLVDVLYEHRVRLVASAAAPPLALFDAVVTQAEACGGGGASEPDLLVDDNLGFAKDRAVSRLLEMQSDEYLRAHAEARAPELLFALEEGRRAARAGGGGERRLRAAGG